MRRFLSKHHYLQYIREEDERYDLITVIIPIREQPHNLYSQTCLDKSFNEVLVVFRAFKDSKL